MTKWQDIFEALSRPFDPQDIKTRPAGGGRTVRYGKPRTYANRFDEVIGPENWETEFYEVRGVLFCRLTLTFPDGTKASKCDAGGFKEMFEKGRDGRDVIDQENTDKTGPSDAFKRAASMWGVGRFLYDDGVPDYDQSTPTHADHEPEPHREPSNLNSQVAPAPAQRSPSSGTGNDAPPRSGKALYARVKDLEKLHELAILKPLDQWAKDQGLPYKMMEWDGDQVALGYGFVLDMIARIGKQGPEYENQDPEPPPPRSTPSRSSPPPMQTAATLPAPVGGKGPCSIAKGDPLEHLKLQIRDVVKGLCFHSLGQNPTEVECQQRIDLIASEITEDKVLVRSLRDCRDKPLLEEVLRCASTDAAAIGGAA